MEIESLAGLKAAFDQWRSKKRHPREAVPADLLGRACRAARRHGAAAVARATKVDRGRLKTGGPRHRGKRTTSTPVPAFSRVNLGAPAAVAAPFAELEMATGLKLRLFAQTDETLELLSNLCAAGGAR
jgi:hypothetical protein